MNVKTKPPRWAVLLSRDTLIFIGGLAGIIHETLASTNERPTLLILFGAMIGLPAFLRIDEVRKNSNGGGKPPAAPPTGGE